LCATAEQPGCLGTSWGYTQENPGMVVTLVGWQNLAVHRRYTRTEVYQIASLPYNQGITESKNIHFKFQ